MEIGFATAAGLWLLSGAFFWMGFVAMGFGFRSADEETGLGRASGGSHGPANHARGVPAPVMARTRE